MRDKTDTLIGTLRKGDALEVEWLCDIADTMAQMFQRLEEIHRRGAYVYEKATGRRSNKEAIEMIRDATPYLKKGLSTAQAKANALGKGRPEMRRELSREHAERYWFDMRLKTNKEALKKMKGWNLAAAYRAFGPSGRSTPGRPKTKR